MAKELLDDPPRPFTLRYQIGDSDNHLVIQGRPLHHFSVDERLAWMTARETTLEEDKAYSLAGMFDMYLAPVYGEGFAQAHKRLLEPVHKREKCVRDLRLSNPYDDKKRIEHTKGGLLVDAYDWILGHSQAVQRRESGQRRVLWIRGDPGKGETMLLCSIINELKNQLAERDLLSYFFCQASDARINNATAVLRGLVLLLIDQQPLLTSHIQQEYDRSGRKLFEDENSWFALSDIFMRMLQDASFRRAYLTIDALDECVEGADRLLDPIRQTTRVSTRITGLVSSRNWPSIKEQMASVDDHDEVSLELNADAVSRAVRVFIKHRVLQLTAQKNYSKDLQSTVLLHLYTNAKDTFLSRYLAHANHVAGSEGMLDDETRASLLDRVGRCQASLGLYAAAEIAHRQALTIREKVLGAEHSDTLTSMSNLALVLDSQGKYEAAELIHRQALVMWEKVGAGTNNRKQKCKNGSFSLKVEFTVALRRSLPNPNYALARDKGICSSSHTSTHECYRHVVCLPRTIV
ncbi:hypothetical protein LTR49_024960 [Elasticomyces elasticus]|nr:hypothetical protein LTR49_024960 [Elasticomyces elasticus]